MASDRGRTPRDVHQATRSRPAAGRRGPVMLNHWISLSLGGLLLAGCRPPAPVHVTGADMGRRIDLLMNQEMDLRLEANPTTGYRWQVIHAAPAVLDVLAEER